MIPFAALWSCRLSWGRFFGPSCQRAISAFSEMHYPVWANAFARFGREEALFPPETAGFSFFIPMKQIMKQKKILKIIQEKERKHTLERGCGGEPFSGYPLYGTAGERRLRALGFIHFAVEILENLCYTIS